MSLFANPPRPSSRYEAGRRAGESFVASDDDRAVLEAFRAGELISIERRRHPSLASTLDRVLSLKQPGEWLLLDVDDLGVVGFTAGVAHAAEVSTFVDTVLAAPEGDREALLGADLARFAEEYRR